VLSLSILAGMKDSQYLISGSEVGWWVEIVGPVPTVCRGAVVNWKVGLRVAVCWMDKGMSSVCGGYGAGTKGGLVVVH